MGNVKTAISLEKSLFEQAESLAHELNISRSRLLAIALEDFIRHYENRQLLERINRVYDDAPVPTEQTLLRSMRRRQRRIVEGEW
jgi:metal-responsive CopG/Arc/MetJ family transcriptional regulator